MKHGDQNTANTVGSSEITDGAIVNADINSSAAIVGTKLVAGTDTARGTLELATDTEAVTGTDTARAVTAANVVAKLAAPGAIGGTTAAASNFTTVGLTSGLSVTRTENTSNLGITLGSGVLAVTGAEGTALSATNIGYINIPSKGTPGKLLAIPVVADQAFIDDAGASEIIDNLFGATTGVAWANDVPFYIYAVSSNDEATIAFMISRVPHFTTSPAVGEIGAPDDAVADESFSFFSFDNIDESLYDANPCVCIGSFRMRMTTSDDWTVQTLGNSDGIGQFQEGVMFTMPLAQRGASSGTYLQPNSGTAAIFTSNTYEYFITKSGNVTVHIRQDADGGTDGATGVDAAMSLPVDVSSDYAINPILGSFHIDSATGGERIIFSLVAATTNNLFFIEIDKTFVQHSDFGNGARRIHGTVTYKAALA